MQPRLRLHSPWTSARAQPPGHPPKSLRHWPGCRLLAQPHLPLGQTGRQRPPKAQGTGSDMARGGGRFVEAFLVSGGPSRDVSLQDKNHSLTAVASPLNKRQEMGLHGCLWVPTRPSPSPLPSPELAPCTLVCQGGLCPLSFVFVVKILGGRLLKLPCSQGFSENDQGRVTPTGMPRGPLWSCDLKFGGFVSIKNAIGSGRPSALDDQRPPCMIEGGADLVTWSRGPACPRSTRSETSAQISDGFGHGGRGADGTPAPPPASHTRGPCTGSHALTHVGANHTLLFPGRLSI